MGEPGQRDEQVEPVEHVVVSAIGVPVGIPAPPALAERLRRQWSRALSDDPPQVSVDLIGLDPEDGLVTDYAITSRVTLAALEETAGRRLSIHAGAVADADGRALVVIGASGSGKTTAVGRLARRLGYLSDETASMDDDLRVHPHPKPLSVVVDPDHPRTKSSVSPDDVGLVVPPEVAHLHRIVVLRRGSEEAGLELLDTARAIVEIVAQTSSLPLLDRPLLRLAETIDACGGVWALHYREVEDWLDTLVGLLDEPAAEPQPHIHHSRPDAPSPHPAGTWRRREWLDAVQFDEELVLMIGDTAHVLAGLGVVTWLALETPRTADELVAHAEGVLGAHPDAAALVAQALDELTERGVVVPPDAGVPAGSA